MERNQILENALRVFNDNPECEKLFAFSDGNIFFPKDKNFILEYERNSKLKSFEISRSELIEGAEETKTQPQMIKYILTDEDIKNNPEFTEKGLKAGDEIEVPAKDSDNDKE